MRPGSWPVGSAVVEATGWKVEKCRWVTVLELVVARVHLARSARIGTSEGHKPPPLASVPLARPRIDRARMAARRARERGTWRRSAPSCASWRQQRSPDLPRCAASAGGAAMAHARQQACVNRRVSTGASGTRGGGATSFALGRAHLRQQPVPQVVGSHVLSRGVRGEA